MKENSVARLSLLDNIQRLIGSHKAIDDSFFESLADSLIEGDLGPSCSYAIIDELEKLCKKDRSIQPDAITVLLATMLEKWLYEAEFIPPANKVSVYLFLGVNGVGKTTTAAKLGNWFKSAGTNVVFAAADTFRAAAIEQLQTHGERLGIRVVSHAHGADPGAVIHDASQAVRSAGGGLVLADTAGRLHNKENLVRELQKIDKIASSRADDGCYKKILVLDATTGQNGLRQAETFNDAIGVDGIVLTKYDSSARGGIAVSAGKELAIPVLYVGTGETYNDISRFDKKKYLREFLGIET